MEKKEFSWISPYKTPPFLFKKNGHLSGIIQVKLKACQSRAAGPLTSPLEIDFFWLHCFICPQSFLSCAHIITANNKSRAPFPLKPLFSTVLLCIMTISLSVSILKVFCILVSKHWSNRLREDKCSITVASANEGEEKGQHQYRRKMLHMKCEDKSKC